ncbi:MAG TPA: zf-HC2 domain-containing protein [Terriglobales bacterium]|nr:zf-HC2 domain-containing protein [Terriglobales bacterium]
MTCRDLIELLADYLEMTCAPETVAALEAHLAGCAPCQAYLRTYRRTRELAAASERATLPPGMPPEMKAHVRAFLRAQLLADDS